jgi:hypothetical protein
VTVLVVTFLLAATVVIGGLCAWDAFMAFMDERRERSFGEIHELDPGGHVRILRDE